MQGPNNGMKNKYVLREKIMLTLLSILKQKKTKKLHSFWLFLLYF